MISQLCSKNFGNDLKRPVSSEAYKLDKTREKYGLESGGPKTNCGPKVVIRVNQVLAFLVSSKTCMYSMCKDLFAATICWLMDRYPPKSL